MKNHFKTMHGVTFDNLPLHLDEYIYRWNCKNEGDIFDLILNDIAEQNILLFTYCHVPLDKWNFLNTIQIIPIQIISVKCVYFIPFVRVVMIWC